MDIIVSRQGRVVEHLLDNALKFTMAGRVEVSLNILEGLDDEDPLIVINVLDTGVGMTQEQVQNSFSKYWQDVTVLNRYIEKEIGVKIRMDSIRSQSLDGFDSPTTMSRVSSLAAAPLVNIGNPDERPGSKGSESFERLFEKSFDIESKDTFKEVQGLGVGLNVINNIIQCMGVSSNPSYSRKSYLSDTNSRILLLSCFMTHFRFPPLLRARWILQPFPARRFFASP